MKCHCGGNGRCQPRRIVHPTQHQCVHCCSEDVVEHIHPVHTTIMNHHVTRNRHVFQETMSCQNTNSQVNEHGGHIKMPMNHKSCHHHGHMCSGENMMNNDHNECHMANDGVSHHQGCGNTHGYQQSESPWQHPNWQMNNWK